MTPRNTDPDARSSTLTELLAGAETRKADPAWTDIREELEARLAELADRTRRADE